MKTHTSITRFRSILFLACCAAALQNGLAGDPLDTWHLKNESSGDVLNSVAYGGGKFIAVGKNNLSFSSVAGTSWDFGSRSKSANLNDIIYGGGFFLVIGDVTQGVSPILTSKDGVTWNPASWTKQNPGPTQPLYGAAYGEGRFVIVGGFGVIYTSADGNHWSQAQSANRSPLVDAKYGAGKFVAVGGQGAIVVSSDAVNWSTGPNLTTKDFLAVTYGRGRFVAVGEEVVSVSWDGIRWSPVQKLPTTFRGITYGCGFFVATGDTGQIITSTDGVNWTNRQSGIADNLGRVTYSGRTFVTVGVNGKILQSDPIIGFDSQEKQIDGTMRLTFMAEAARSYAVEVSEDLEVWLPITALAGRGELETVIDDGAVETDSRFYRLVLK